MTDNKKALIGPILSDGNNHYKLSDLKKTREYGGKETGFSVRLEQLEIASINNVLEEIKLANNLSPSKLVEYDWRIKVFLQKFGNEEPFEFMSGPRKILVYSAQIAKLIQQKRVDKLQGKIFLGRNKKTYELSDLKLTKDFAEYEGFGTEAKEINSTVGQLQEAKTELASAIVPLRIHSDIYEVIGIEKTQGSPKSDFHFLNHMKQEIVWISHKDGKRPTDFQQWSGMTEKGIQDDKEIQDFIASVKVIFPLGIDKGITVGRKIENNTLKMKAVYGVDYGSSFGRQNVTVVMQGPIDIRAEGKYYRVCSNHVLVNGEKVTGDYEPVMVAMYRGDRNQFGVNHARFSIYPQGGRIINDFI